VGRGYVAVAAAAAAALAAAAVAAPATARSADVSWSVIASGSRPGTAESVSAYLFRSAAPARFSELLAVRDATRLAGVDYSRYAVALVVAPFPTCGWSVRVRGAERSGVRLRVSFIAQPPPTGSLVCEALTRGYAAVRVPRTQIRGLVRALAVRAQ